jgi:uncharacterized sulfatase
MSATRPPHIVLIILDAVRAANMSAYTNGRPTTPRLDELAAGGLLFRRAIAPATWTVPTHASLLSGLYVSEHRIESVQVPRRFNQSVVTLPAALGRRGYLTAAFSQNELFGARNNLSQGFHTFYERGHLPAGGWRAALGRDKPGWRESLPVRYIRRLVAPRATLDALTGWLRQNGAGRPLFAMVNLTSAHYPWAPPPLAVLRRFGWRVGQMRQAESWDVRPYRYNSGRWPVTDRLLSQWRGLYQIAIAHLDREMGRFVRRLRRIPGADNTIIIVTADHGEMLGEHRGIVGHMLTVHDHLLRVPLIIHHPDYRPGTIVEGVVQTHDLYPSLLEWAGAPLAGIHPAQLKRPPLSQALAEPGSRAGVAFAEEDYSDSYDVLAGLLKTNKKMDPRRYPRQQVAARSADHKLIWCDDRPAEFYDLSADPNEQRDLMAEGAADPAAVARLEEALAGWRAGLTILPPQAGAADTTADDEAVMERLRALGYVA